MIACDCTDVVWVVALAVLSYLIPLGLLSVITWFVRRRP